MTVEDLLNRISSRELTEWIALWAIRSEEREEAQRNRRR